LNETDIGAGQYTTLQNFMNGSIDEVRIYDRALSADEVMELYRAGARTFGVNTPMTQKYTGGLVGNWTFNGPDVDWATNTAYDRSGQGNNGDITNMNTSTAPTIGKIGQALEFDGGDDYVDINTSASLNLSSNNKGTLTAWAYYSSVPDDQDRFVTHSENNDFWIGVGFGSASGEFTALLYDGAQKNVDSNVAVSDYTNQWVYIVGTFDGSNVKLYVNGQGKGSTGAGNINYEGGDYRTTIGSAPAAAGGLFNGIIDEVRIYNRALSAEEIQQLYRAGAGRLKF